MHAVTHAPACVCLHVEEIERIAEPPESGWPVDPVTVPSRGGDLDLLGLAHHVRTILEAKLSPRIVYHDISHTFDEVVPAAERLAASENMTRGERDLIRAAALLHDTGFIEGPDEHEDKSVAIARRLLPRFGFSCEQIDEISGLILATRPDRLPETLGQAILTDADLDVLGREDFWIRNVALRRELADVGIHYDDVAWWRGQLRFLESHRYYTVSARRDRQQKKEENMRRIQVCLARLEDAREQN